MISLERATMLEALACFAWVDGVVDEGERARIAEFVKGSAREHARDYDALVSVPRALTPDLAARIASMSAEDVCQLLAFADVMCNAARPASRSESELMRKICASRFGDAEWSRVSSWLEHQRKANALLDDLIEQHVIAS